MIRKNFKKVILACALLTLPAQHIYANAPEPFAQTFGDISTFGVFDPSHNYLDTGTAIISNPSTGKIRITTNTYAMSNVDQVGVKLYIDQLVGNAWVQIITRTDLYSTNTDEHYGSFVATVDASNTYRIRCTFWVKNDNVTEEGSRSYSLTI